MKIAEIQAVTTVATATTATFATFATFATTATVVAVATVVTAVATATVVSTAEVATAVTTVAVLLLKDQCLGSFKIRIVSFMKKIPHFVKDKDDRCILGVCCIPVMGKFRVYVAWEREDNIGLSFVCFKSRRTYMYITSEVVKDTVSHGDEITDPKLISEIFPWL